MRTAGIVTLLSVIGSLISVWLFVGGGNLHEYYPPLRDFFSPHGMRKDPEGQGAGPSAVRPSVPRAPEGFSYSAESAEKLIPTVCQEIEPEGSCYKKGWKPWVRDLAR